MFDMETATFTPLHERLRIAAGSRTYRQLGDLTGTNHETVRRYMLGQAPSAEFLAAVCGSLDINAQWLLVGAGAMKGTEIRAHSLGEAKVSELLSAMSTTLERLMDRVDRLESYMQVLEAHLRAQAGETTSGPDTPRAGETPWANNPPVRGIEGPDLGTDDAATNAPNISKERIEGVLRALPKRPRPNAD